MKRHGLIFLAGGVVGVVFGLIAVYFNPLTDRAADILPPTADLTLHYDFPNGDVLAFTHRDHSRLPFTPEGIAPLWEAAVRSVSLSVLTLHSDDGKPVGVAARLSMPALATDPLLTGLLLDDYWLVTLPGQGSIFVHAINNVWPFVKDNVIPVSVLGRPWAGPHIYLPTVGPSGDRKALIVGGTGKFAGRTGAAAELYRLNQYSRAQGLQDMVGVIAIDFAAESKEAEKESAP